MDILIKDGVKYVQHIFQKENEFEKVVFTQYKHIFGENAILFSDKQKIKTENGTGTIPDAFVIDFENEKWYIIEVELSHHPIYNHIQTQVSKFVLADKYSQTKKDLIKSFESEIKADPTKEAILLANGKKEIFKTVNDIIEKKPTVIIIIEQQTNELSDVLSLFNFEPVINIFKVFYRDCLEQKDSIFQIEPLINSKPQAIIQTKNKATPKKKDEPKIDTHKAQGYYKEGKAKAKIEDYMGAIQDYTKAIEIDPKYRTAYLYRGYAKDGLEDYEGAIEDYTKAIELDRTYSAYYAYHSRGQAKFELEDYKGALQDYDKVLELVCNNEVYYDRGNAKAELKDYKGAIEDFTKFIADYPEDADAYNNRGVAKFDIQDYKGAIKDYNKAIELEEDADFYYNRGEAKQKSGDIKGACLDWEKAVELGDTDAKDAKEMISKYCK